MFPIPVPIAVITALNCAATLWVRGRVGRTEGRISSRNKELQSILRVAHDSQVVHIAGPAYARRVAVAVESIRDSRRLTATRDRHDKRLGIAPYAILLNLGNAAVRRRVGPRDHLRVAPTHRVPGPVAQPYNARSAPEAGASEGERLRIAPRRRLDTGKQKRIDGKCPRIAHDAVLQDPCAGAGGSRRDLRDDLAVAPALDGGDCPTQPRRPAPCEEPKPEPLIVTEVPGAASAGATPVMAAVLIVKGIALDKSPHCCT